MDPIYVILIIAASLIAVILLISYVCYSMAFKAEKGERDPHAPIKLAGYSHCVAQLSRSVCE